MQDDSLKNKVVWITGASSGIGRALVELLLTKDALVIASSRKLDAIAHLMEKYPTQLTYISTDVTDPSSIQECINQIAIKFQKIDIAILNAGNCIYVDINNFKTEVIRENFAVNFFGMVSCFEAVLPLLRKSTAPQLVGMSSSVAYFGIPRAEGYGAAKAASRYFMQALQARLFPEIAVSIICPGFVKTPLTDENDFPMPFIINAEIAAKIIVKGIISKKPEIAFPWRLILLSKLISYLPDRLRIKLLAAKLKNI